MWIVLRILKEHHLFAKCSKCKFRCVRVDYLGHVILGNGITVDPKKLQVIKDWPLPKNPKSLRGFLKLTDYCRKFVHSYGSITAPLNQMLKKGEFKWMEESKDAFERLKEVLVTPPILTMPNFDEDLVLECDALKEGIRAVLMQSGHPLAYISQGLKSRVLSLSIKRRCYPLS